MKIYFSITRGQGFPEAPEVVEFDSLAFTTKEGRRMSLDINGSIDYKVEGNNYEGRAKLFQILIADLDQETEHREATDAEIAELLEGASEFEAVVYCREESVMLLDTEPGVSLHFVFAFANIDDIAYKTPEKGERKMKKKYTTKDFQEILEAISEEVGRVSKEVNADNLTHSENVSVYNSLTTIYLAFLGIKQ